MTINQIRARERNFNKRRISAIKASATALAKSKVTYPYERMQLLKISTIAEDILKHWIPEAP